MATKCIVIGARPTKKEVTRISFESSLSINLNITNANASPRAYKTIELICKNYSYEVDLMFAYNDPNKRHEGVLYLGHWNDGIV